MLNLPCKDLAANIRQKITYVLHTTNINKIRRIDCNSVFVMCDPFAKPSAFKEIHIYVIMVCSVVILSVYYKL